MIYTVVSKAEQLLDYLLAIEQALLQRKEQGRRKATSWRRRSVNMSGLLQQQQDAVSNGYGGMEPQMTPQFGQRTQAGGDSSIAAINRRARQSILLHLAPPGQGDDYPQRSVA
jgi:hypothetical protein